VMAVNALGLSTLVVGECPKDTLPLARLLAKQES